MEDVAAKAMNEIQDYVKGAGIDIEILVDNSGSMKQENRQYQAMEVAKLAAKVGALVDEDGGVGLTFFSDFDPRGNSLSWEDVVLDQIEEKFKGVTPDGSTDTLKFIEGEVKQHYERKATKPDQRTLIVCITDGEPNGGTAPLKAYLTELQAKLDWSGKLPEIKVLFIQVGTAEEAKAALKDLDDDNDKCGLIVEVAYTGKDGRPMEQIFFDALREHYIAN